MSILWLCKTEAGFDAEDVKVGDQLSFQVEDNTLQPITKAFYNVYNILAAYAGVRGLRDFPLSISRICFKI